MHFFASTIFVFLPARDFSRILSGGFEHIYKNLHKNLLAFPTKGTKYCFYLRCLYACLSDSLSSPLPGPLLQVGRSMCPGNRVIFFQYGKHTAFSERRGGACYVNGFAQQSLTISLSLPPFPSQISHSSFFFLLTSSPESFSGHLL